MKRIISAVLIGITAIQTAGCVFAVGESIKAQSVDFHFVIDQSNPTISDTASFELKIGNDTYTQTAEITPMTENIDVHFDTDTYKIGTTMTLTLTDGAKSLRYYDNFYTAGEGIDLYTYAEVIGDETKIITDFSLSCTPNHLFRIDMYKDYERIPLTYSAYLDGETCMVPIIEVAQALGLEAYYDERYNSVYTGIGDSSVLFNIGTQYATVLGEDVTIPVAPGFAGWTIMAPLRTLTDAFDVEVVVQDEGSYYNVNIGRSEVERKYNDEYARPHMVNNISSRTKYLIWVSKSEFAVRVYEGSKGNWKIIKKYPCSIGAPWTPTITGQYEYIEKQAYWNYGSYYCGPIMRFHNGYALHSTLQYWGGGAYDGRLGMMISHGCVRMDPPDINWMASNIPLYTRIYITN